MDEHEYGAEDWRHVTRERVAQLWGVRSFLRIPSEEFRLTFATEYTIIGIDPLTRDDRRYVETKAAASGSEKIWSDDGRWEGCDVASCSGPLLDAAGMKST